MFLKVRNNPNKKQDHVAGSRWITRKVKLTRGPRSWYSRGTRCCHTNITNSKSFYWEKWNM